MWPLIWAESFVDGCQHFLQWLYKGVVKEMAERERERRTRETDRSKVTLASYPESHQLCDRRLILSQGAHIGLLLEGGHIVIDIQHVDPDPACGLLTTSVPGNDCQGEALDELVVQSGNQHDESCILVQREPVSGRKMEGKGHPGLKQFVDKGLHLPTCPCPRRSTERH